MPHATMLLLLHVVIVVVGWLGLGLGLGLGLFACSLGAFVCLLAVVSRYFKRLPVGPGPPAFF